MPVGPVGREWKMSAVLRRTAACARGRVELWFLAVCDKAHDDCVIGARVSELWGFSRKRGIGVTIAQAAGDVLRGLVPI